MEAVRIRCIKTIIIRTTRKTAFSMGKEYEAVPQVNGKWLTTNDYGGEHFLSRSSTTTGMKFFHEHFIQVSDVDDAYERAMSII